MDAIISNYKLDKDYYNIKNGTYFLPQILIKVKNYLFRQNILLSKESDDGRINSNIDEKIIIKFIKIKFNNKCKIPKKRHWFDIQLFDDVYGWIPINIKTTTMKTSDNIGNLAMCLYAYTNEQMDLEKYYDNGKVHVKLFNKIKNREFNYKRDYYFLVINKNNKDIIINSVKGLTILTSNLNNLPFQIKWNDNKEFKLILIDDNIKKFISCYSNISWLETFLQNMRELFKHPQYHLI